ncbi:hypothetical protein MRB53_038113 [Persea americana]|nr:hypothetical protein MRB53_038113 [Persea americana]
MIEDRIGYTAQSTTPFSTSQSRQTPHCTNGKSRKPSTTRPAPKSRRKRQSKSSRPSGAPSAQRSSTARSTARRYPPPRAFSTSSRTRQRRHLLMTKTRPKARARPPRGGELGAYVGSPVERQSLKFFWLEETTQGENPFVAGTYEGILDSVAETAKRSARILLSEKVVRVVAAEHGHTVRLESDGKNSGEFDEVIVTSPLGWLQRNTALFSPELPNEMVESIMAIGYGCLDKVCLLSAKFDRETADNLVYITFATAFWDKPTASTHKVKADAAIPNTRVTVASSVSRLVAGVRSLVQLHALAASDIFFCQFSCVVNDGSQFRRSASDMCASHAALLHSSAVLGPHCEYSQGDAVGEAHSRAGIVLRTVLRATSRL